MLAKLACFVVLMVAAVNAQTGATIEGRITNGTTGEGVAGVSVRILNRKSRVFTATTDASGSYRIEGLDDADYNASFAREGFIDTTMPYFHAGAGAPTRVDGKLTPWASLKGRVIDEDGKPAPKILVRLTAARTLTTDEDGEFSFDKLRASIVTLRAQPQSKIRIVDGQRLAAVPTYFPSATEFSQAVPINVRSGANVEGIEIRLRSEPVHRVTGVVLGPSGKPMLGAVISLLAPSPATKGAISAMMLMNIAGNTLTTIGPEPEQAIANAVSAADGTFEFPAVPSGQWRVTARALPDRNDLFGVGDVSVGKEDVLDLQIPLSASFPVSLIATWEESKKPNIPAWAFRGLSFLAEEGQPPPVNVHLQDETAVYQLYPGRYRVVSQSLGTDYASSVMLGGRNVDGQLVEPSPGMEPGRITFKTDISSVHGVAKGAAMVLLTPRTATEISRVYTTELNADGSFDIRGVVPGDYLIIAFDRKDSIPWGSIPDGILPIASSLKVEAQSSPNVELPVRQWPW